MRNVFFLGVIATSVVAAACSSSDESKPETAPPLSINQAANDPIAEAPVDATPSPDGADIYFLAHSRVDLIEKDANEQDVRLGFERQAGIFKVSSQGGPVTRLAIGEPLASPFGITISDDGQTLFIADSGAETSEDRADGKVFTMPVGGGTPVPLPGTEGLAPGGVEVSGDSLYITGRRDGKAGLFKMGVGGGAVSAVSTDPLFVDPSGVAVSRKGDVYVVDSGNAMSAQALASVIKVGPDGKTEVLLEGLNVGHPAGIALTNDDSTVLVSGFSAEKGTDVVFTLKLGTNELAEFTDTIGEFTESAGLHRARNTNVFAWADSRANNTGTVYTVRLDSK